MPIDNPVDESRQKYYINNEKLNEYSKNMDNEAQNNNGNEYTKNKNNNYPIWILNNNSEKEKSKNIYIIKTNFNYS